MQHRQSQDFFCLYDQYFYFIPMWRIRLGPSAPKKKNESWISNMAHVSSSQKSPFTLLFPSSPPKCIQMKKAKSNIKHQIKCHCLSSQGENSHTPLSSAAAARRRTLPLQSAAAIVRVRCSMLPHSIARHRLHSAAAATAAERCLQIVVSYTLGLLCRWCSLYTVQCSSITCPFW